MFLSGTISRYQHHNVMTLRRVIFALDHLRTLAHVMEAVASFNIHGIYSPLYVLVDADQREATVNRIHIYEGNVGLPVSQLYKPGRVLQKYRAYLTACAEHLGLHEFGRRGTLFDADDAIRLEQELVLAFVQPDDRNDPLKYYSRVKPRQLAVRWPHVPWDALFAALSLPLKELAGKEPHLIVHNPRYLATLDRLFRTVSVDRWRNLLTAMAINALARFLPPPFDELQFEVFGRALSGAREKDPQVDLTLDVVEQTLPDALGRLYVERYVPADVRPRAIHLMESVRASAIRRIKAADWMSEAARAMAAHKMARMVFKVAYPPTDQWETYDSLEVRVEGLLDNILAANELEYTQELKNIGKRVQKGKWDDAVFRANAYYYSEGNEMVIPVGILQPPFFSVHQSVAANLGGIGAVVGHEMTHGFDMDGRRYDADGNMRDWWTAKDEAVFVRMTNRFVRQYSAHKLYGHPVNGKLTLSENIADLSGVAIALDALKHHIGDADVPENSRLAAYRTFFSTFARTWATKERRKRTVNRLLVDPHAPPMLRVNMVVTQFDEFYEAYGIGEDHPIWVAKKDRLSLW
jgi:putative endopeptidase